jgi:glycosyltransferase involved in cell wall biosynthesis
MFPVPIWELARFIYRRLFRVYKNIPTITVSDSTRIELIMDFWYFPEAISVIKNTTDIVPIESINFESKTNDLVFLGRLTSIKRPDHAIRAFFQAMIYIPIDSRLHIIGNAQDTKYVDWLHKMVKKMNIDNRVIFHGYLSQDEYAYILSTSRCLLVPSEKEWYGLVVIEANAYGLPVIGYDVAWLRDSIRPWVNGALIPDWDYAQMSREIVDMFANDAKYHTLCDSSLEYVKHISKWSEQVEKLEKIITQK